MKTKATTTLAIVAMLGAITGCSSHSDSYDLGYWAASRSSNSVIAKDFDLGGATPASWCTMTWRQARLSPDTAPRAKSQDDFIKGCKTYLKEQGFS